MFTGLSASTSALNVGAAAAPDDGPANIVLAVWFFGVGNVKVPAADAGINVVAKMVLSPANCPASTLLVVGRVSVGVAELAGAVSVYRPDAVALAKAIVPVDVPGIPNTGAVVYAGAAAEVVLFPNTVPPPALLKENVKDGVVVGVPTFVVNSGLRFPALKLVTVPVPAGRSAATNDLNVGVAAAPVVGPAHTVFAVSVAKDTAKVPLVVIGLPPTENMAGIVRATLVT